MAKSVSPNSAYVLSGAGRFCLGIGVLVAVVAAGCGVGELLFGTGVPRLGDVIQDGLLLVFAGPIGWLMMPAVVAYLIVSIASEHIWIRGAMNLLAFQAVNSAMELTKDRYLPIELWLVVFGSILALNLGPWICGKWARAFRSGSVN